MVTVPTSPLKKVTYFVHLGLPSFIHEAHHMVWPGHPPALEKSASREIQDHNLLRAFPHVSTDLPDYNHGCLSRQSLPIHYLVRRTRSRRQLCRLRIQGSRTLLGDTRAISEKQLGKQDIEFTSLLRGALASCGQKALHSAELVASLQFNPQILVSKWTGLLNYAMIQRV